MGACLIKGLENMIRFGESKKETVIKKPHNCVNCPADYKENFPVLKKVAHIETYGMSSMTNLMTLEGLVTAF